MFKRIFKSPLLVQLAGPRSRLWAGVALIGLVFSRGSLLGQSQQSRPSLVRIDLDQAIGLALEHDHALKAGRTLIQQSRAQETTASIRPNPVLIWDALFIPVFSPHALNHDTLNNISEFDVGVGYTFERGHKRRSRMEAARDQTAVTSSQVSDSERGLRLNVAQQFLGALLAKSNLELANKNLEDFRKTVDVSESRYKAGDISQGDFLKIKLQLLQFQTDVSAAQLALVQALASLRQLIGYDGVPADYDVVGDLQYTPLQLNQEDLQAIALKNRPDLVASQQGVTAAQSQYRLAQSNGKRDLTTTVDYTHVSALNNASFIFNIEIPVFNRNQGEIARTQFAITQAEENQRAVVDTALTDVANAFQAVKTNEKIVQLYVSGYLQQAQDSRDISEYAYKQGAASLLDFLDAERSYRATQLAYRQAMANYMLTVEQLKAAAGTRTLSH